MSENYTVPATKNLQVIENTRRHEFCLRLPRAAVPSSGEGEFGSASVAWEATYEQAYRSWREIGPSGDDSPLGGRRDSPAGERHSIFLHFSGQRRLNDRGDLVGL